MKKLFMDKKFSVNMNYYVIKVEYNGDEKTITIYHDKDLKHSLPLSDYAINTLFELTFMKCKALKMDFSEDFCKASMAIAQRINLPFYFSINNAGDELWWDYWEELIDNDLIEIGSVEKAHSKRNLDAIKKLKEKFNES